MKTNSFENPTVVSSEKWLAARLAEKLLQRRKKNSPAWATSSRSAAASSRGVKIDQNFYTFDSPRAARSRLPTSSRAAAS